MWVTDMYDWYCILGPEKEYCTELILRHIIFRKVFEAFCALLASKCAKSVIMTKKKEEKQFDSGVINIEHFTVYHFRICIHGGGGGGNGTPNHSVIN
jgi:hypothetical protein